MTTKKQSAPGEVAADLAASEWVLVAEGEGAAAQLVVGDVREALHRFMCCCGKGFEGCQDTEVRRDINQIDDPDEWSNDEDGKRFAFHWRQETGVISLYCLSSESSVNAHGLLREAEEAATVRLRRELIDALNAAEFGFKCHERGFNWDKTAASLKEQFFAGNVARPSGAGDRSQDR